MGCLVELLILPIRLLIDILYLPFYIVGQLLIMLFGGLVGGAGKSFNQSYRPSHKWFWSSYQMKNLTDVDEMSGREFEEYLASLLEENDFKNVRVTKSSGDHGIDIIAVRDGQKYGIQCKRYKAKVGNFAVHEALSGAKYYDCDVAVAATNNYFTRQAEVEAKKVGVLLWDRNQLGDFIKNSEKKKDKIKVEKPKKKKEHVRKSFRNEDIIIDESIEYVVTPCPQCNVGLRVKKTNGGMLAIRCTRCGYRFMERT